MPPITPTGIETARWARIAALAEAAIALPPASRAAYLAAACGADVGLLAEVMSLLTHHQEDEARRGSSALEPLADGVSTDTPPWIPDRFERLDYLGSGGFGTVYRAYDRVHRQWVALKVLRHLDPTQLHRFKQEFRRTTTIHHRNVIRMLELFAEVDHWFFTMELVDGPGLVDYIRGHGQPDGGLTSGATLRLFRMFQQVVEGVSALHAAGIVHGNLKPQNVVVTADGRVVLLDFGLVRDITQQPSRVVGTPAYMAPELLTQEPASEAADWYSVGILLYEAMSGTVPFDGSFLDMLWKKQQGVVRLPETAGYPESMVALCHALLQRHPEQRPGAHEIRQQFLELLPPRSDPVSENKPLFVGRRRHLQVLRDAFTRVTGGHSTAVLVNGVSGIGKSALVRRFIEAVRQEHDVVVLAGRCYESESVPFKALDELVDALGRYLGGLEPAAVAALLPRDAGLLTRVFPTLLKISSIVAHPLHPVETLGAQELRDRALSALLELLERLAVRHHVVLWIDDLQWGDFDSLRVLRDLQKPGSAPCLLLLLSYRREDIDTSPLLEAVIDAGAAGRVVGGVLDLDVEAMRQDEAQELAVALGTDLTVEQRDGLIQEAGGNPLFLSELVRHSAGNRGATEYPPTLIEMMQQRVQMLPPSSRRLLDVIAVAGQPLDREVAIRAAEPDDAGAEAQLLAAFLVRTARWTATRELDTYHDKVREAVLGLMPDQEQRDYHRRLALAFEASGDVDPERLVHHFMHAGIEDAAYRCAVQAALTAEHCLAFDQAAALLRLALDLRRRLTRDPSEEPTVNDLYSREAHALANAGRSVEAAKAYLRAAEWADARDVDDLRSQAVDQLMRGGQINEGLSLLTSRLRETGMLLPRDRRLVLAAAMITRLRVRVRGITFRERPADAIEPAILSRIDRLWTAGATLVSIDPLLGSYLRGRHLLMALRAGEPYRVSAALSLEAVQRAMHGAVAYPAARRILDRAREIAGRCDQPYAEATLLAGETGVGYFSGRIRDALRYGVKAEEALTARCAGVAWELATIRVLILAALNVAGQWKEYAARLGKVLREAEGNGDRYGQFALPLTVSSYVTFLAADDPAGARRELDYRLNQWARAEFDIPQWTHALGTIESLLYEQDFAGAWRLVNEAWPGLRSTHMLRIETIRMAAGHAKARCAISLHSTEPRAELLAVAERFAKDCGRSQSALIQGWGLLIDAAVRASRGNQDATIARLHMAEDRLAAVGAEPSVAASRRQRGRLIGGEAGAALIRSADADLATLGVVNPQRMADRLVPGVSTSSLHARR